MAQKLPLLTRSDILGCEIRTGRIHVPQWGGWVRYRELTADEQGKMGAAIIGPDNKPDLDKAMNVAHLLVCWCVIDENGDRVFNDDDAPQLAQARGAAIATVGKAIMAISGLAAGDDIPAGDNGSEPGKKEKAGPN